MWLSVTADCASCLVDMCVVVMQHDGRKKDELAILRVRTYVQRPSGEVSLQPSVEHQNRIGVSSIVCVVGSVGGGICT